MTYEPEPARTALLIIDAQREYFDPDGALFTEHAAGILENLLALLDGARRSGTRVVWVRHVQAADGSDTGRMADFDDTPSFVAGTPGVEIIPQLVPRADEPVVDKTRYSAFVNTRLESILKTWGVDTVLISGLMTQYCSVTTARHAHDLDYRVIFIADANAGPDLPDLGFGEVPHAEAMRAIATALAGGIADVTDTQLVVAALGEGAGVG
jgi:ureidoacrylate peracid hydrolase